MSADLTKLPIGLQTFKKIVDGDYLYVDKTKHALKLIENYQYVFLSRPRRFGKSLFLDTLHNIFEGNQELFDGLYIYDKWDWQTKYPVIKISFSGGILDIKSFNSKMLDILDENVKRLNIQCQRKKDASAYFRLLIQEVGREFNNNVVILIDEYDKPILDNLENIEVAKEVRDELKNFYTQIKDNDQYIKFAMLTGVSKFSKVSIFSGLNNLVDISLDPVYGDVCGYTQNDIETSFAPYLQDVDKDKLKSWYNGFNFLGTKVYNPYDILLFISKNKVYQNYWFETGTSAYLLQLIKQKNYFLPNLANLEIDSSLANSFDIEDISIETLLLQTGYLTIAKASQKRNRIRYCLSFPNLEVRLSFYDYILNGFSKTADVVPVADGLYEVLEDGRISDLEAIIKRLFASIAYNNFTNNNIANYEGFYASVLYAYFASLGLELIAEDVTNQGRVDLTLRCNDRTYIFEFKVDGTDPLEQIKDKKYYEKYTGERYIVGIIFDKEQRNITSFEYQKI